MANKYASLPSRRLTRRLRSVEFWLIAGLVVFYIIKSVSSMVLLGSAHLALIVVPLVLIVFPVIALARGSVWPLNVLGGLQLFSIASSAISVAMNPYWYRPELMFGLGHPVAFLSIWGPEALLLAILILANKRVLRERAALRPAVAPTTQISQGPISLQPQGYDTETGKAIYGFDRATGKPITVDGFDTATGQPIFSNRD